MFSFDCQEEFKYIRYFNVLHVDNTDITRSVLLSIMKSKGECLAPDERFYNVYNTSDSVMKCRRGRAAFDGPLYFSPSCLLSLSPFPAG